MQCLCHSEFPPPNPAKSSPPLSSYRRTKGRIAGLICLAAVLLCLGFGQGCLGTQPSTLNSQPFLAQLPSPDPAHFANWLACAAAALSIVALGKQFVRKIPLEAQFLSRKEFAEFREKLEQDLNAIIGKIDRSHDLLSHRMDVLSVRIDEVRSLVDRVDERTKQPERGR